MSSKKLRVFRCVVVNEPVGICLRKKPTSGLTGRDRFFVKCDQSECQYVEDNIPPCPLSLSLFEEELQTREEDARLRRDGF